MGKVYTHAEKICALCYKSQFEAITVEEGKEPSPEQMQPWECERCQEMQRLHPDIYEWVADIIQEREKAFHKAFDDYKKKCDEIDEKVENKG